MPALSKHYFTLVSLLFVLGSVAAGAIVQSSASVTVPAGRTTADTDSSRAEVTAETEVVNARADHPSIPTGTSAGSSANCPRNVVAVTSKPGDTKGQVCYSAQVTAGNSQPGVNLTCEPASGSVFPVGVTTVTCASKDQSAGFAECSFTVSLFNARVQDDTDASIVILWNTLNGRYILCCSGTTFTGVGKSTKQGTTFQLEHNAVDRRLIASLSTGTTTATGNMMMQLTGGGFCSFKDRDALNDRSLCGNTGLDCKGK